MASADIASQQQLRDDEIESLRCIYGTDSINHTGGTVQVNIKTLSFDSFLTCTFKLPEKYPAVAGVAVTCRVAGLAEVPAARLAAQKAANTVLLNHIHGEIIFAVTSAAECACEAALAEGLASEAKENPELASAGGRPPIAECRATRVHHMHDQRGYTKYLQNWADEFGIWGGLLTWGRCILLVTGGSSEAVSDFFQQYRTNAVDVDSKGRKCKEKYVVAATSFRLKFDSVLAQNGARNQPVDC